MKITPYVSSDPTYLSVFVLCLVLSGCSTIVADRIASQKSYDYSKFVTAEQLLESGFIPSRHCSAQYELCVSYLRAGPLAEDRFDFDMVINGDHIRLQLMKADVPIKFQGTMVLLHGFKVSKEFMAMTANYYRLLGFSVIVPDMLGHGESEGGISFGIKDGEILNELLDSQPELQRPLYLFGSSMGAIAATHLASNRFDVDGVILQAPMTRFDDSAVNSIQYASPILARLVTARSIRKGASKALRAADMSLARTDIKPALSALEVPVLILASSTDTIAPFSYFNDFASSNISVVEIADRSHYSMVVIDQLDHEHILRWLREQAND